MEFEVIDLIIDKWRKEHFKIINHEDEEKESKIPVECGASGDDPPKRK